MKNLFFGFLILTSLLASAEVSSYQTLAAGAIHAKVSYNCKDSDLLTMETFIDHQTDLYAEQVASTPTSQTITLRKISDDQRTEYLLTVDMSLQQKTWVADKIVYDVFRASQSLGQLVCE